MVGGDVTERDGDLLRWPYVDRTMLDTLLAAADVFVYPTLADNHALVVLEAMTAGVPVCSFRVGGLPEQVEDGVTGALADEGDWGGLAASVAGLLERPGWPAPWAGQGRRRGAPVSPWTGWWKTT